MCVKRHSSGHFKGMSLFLVWVTLFLLSQLINKCAWLQWMRVSSLGGVTSVEEFFLLSHRILDFVLGSSRTQLPWSGVPREGVKWRTLTGVWERLREQSELGMILLSILVDTKMEEMVGSGSVLSAWVLKKATLWLRKKGSHARRKQGSKWVLNI